jgi:hypothetical protein
MNRRDILKIQSHSSYPSVSILMPTHRTFPDNQQDPIRLRNLLNQANQRLLEEFGKKRVKNIIQSLAELTGKIDFNHLLDSLAIFVNDNFSAKYMFPFPVKERVTIDKSFETRDLVFAYNRSQPYYVVVINEKQIKFYLGVRENLSEVIHPGLPMTSIVHEIKEGKIEDASYNDRIRENEERQKNFLREADMLLKEFISAEEIPFLITGTERQISMYREITRFPQLILGSLGGSYENSTSAEISRLIWPVAKEGFAKRRKEIMNEVDKAIGMKKFASGIDEVWKLANEGRGKTLLTEINFEYPAIVSSNGSQLVPTEIKPGEEVLDDAVDEIIESVISKDGKVVFLDNGIIEKYGRIAMILRY